MKLLFSPFRKYIRNIDSENYKYILKKKIYIYIENCDIKYIWNIFLDFKDIYIKYNYNNFFN